MTFSVRSVLGLSILLAAAVGCDDGTSGGGGNGGPQAVTGGAANTGGTSSGGGTSTGGGTATAGVPLTATEGWVDGASNTLGVQGAMFSYADATSGATMTEDFTGTNACITGTAAKVDLNCTPSDPGGDCYGEYWGAAIGLNLNQPIDQTTMMGADPMPFDLSSVTAFSFNISGSTVPAQIRFKVEIGSDADHVEEYCTPSTVPVVTGDQTVNLSDLVTMCWGSEGMPLTAKTSAIKIAWHVVTNDASEVPFDFCVSDIRAVQ